VETLRRFMSEYHGVPLEDLGPHLYVYAGPDAVKHVFRVASSLDSMVVGEPQVLGQVKDAYEKAAEGSATGLVLNKFMHKAFSVAKRVRTETRIAQSAVSISFAAVELARKIFGELEGKKVLIVGAGEMCELAATHLVENGVSAVQVTNRTLARAEALAAKFSGRAVPFEEFTYHLPEVDIVISSTGAPHFVVGVEDVRAAMKARKQKPLFLIDIAVPRDVDPRVNDLPNVYLYDVDDLNGVVEANKKERAKEADKAEAIVADEVQGFLGWLKTLEITPTIRQLREKFDGIRRSEARSFSPAQPVPHQGSRAAPASLDSEEFFGALKREGLFFFAVFQDERLQHGCRCGQNQPEQGECQDNQPLHHLFPPAQRSAHNPPVSGARRLLLRQVGMASLRGASTP
jgi:glutamyl-tRNA reductase